MELGGQVAGRRGSRNHGPDGVRASVTMDQAALRGLGQRPVDGCRFPAHPLRHRTSPNALRRPGGGRLTGSVSRQLFPAVEESMLQPLWESRDRYEELKQMDDAGTEVGPPRGSGWRGPRRVLAPRGGPSGRALVPTQRRDRPTASGHLTGLDVT